MKKIDLKANERKDIGKKATKALRKEAIVPCVMYGGEKTMHFKATERSFKDLVYTPNVYLVNLDIDGKVYKAIVKEIQFHPVTDNILHIDFIEVIESKPITLKMPIELTGSSVGIREGGKLRFRRRWVLCEGLVNDIPDSLVIDISNLKIGDTIQIKDVEFPGVKLIGPSRAMIVGVVSSRIAKGMEEGEVPGMEEVEEGAEAVEGVEGADEGTAAPEGEKEAE